MPKFTAALFTLAKKKTSKVSIEDRWLKTLWYVYIMECVSAIKYNELMPLSATLMDLEMIVLSEGIHTEKDSKSSVSLMGRMEKLVQVNASRKQKQTQCLRKETSGYQRGKVDERGGISEHAGSQGWPEVELRELGRMCQQWSLARGLSGPLWMEPRSPHPAGPSYCSTALKGRWTLWTGWALKIAPTWEVQHPQHRQDHSFL